MAIIPIIKINIVSLKKYEEKILDWLADEGVAQIDQIKKPDEQKSDSDKSIGSKIDYDLAGIDFALRYLSSYKPEEKKTLWEKLAPEKIKMGREKVEELVGKFDFRGLTGDVQNIENDINQTKNELLKLRGEKKALSPWQKFEIAQKEVETKTTGTFLGIISLANIEPLQDELREKVRETEVRVLEQDEKSAYLVVNFKKEREKDLDEVLSKNKVDRVELPYSEMRAGEALAKVDGEIKNGEQKLRDFEKKTKELGKEYKNLQIVFDFLTWEKEKFVAREKFLATRRVIILDAWVEEGKLSEITKQLLKITKNSVVVEKLPPPEKPDEVPVIIENSSVVAPFESVTGIYG
ncbi:hypothetical protein HQ544_03830, partial [Candidatus Falkowbacteria bacterium]|nr:hypothetical protein [Candidatus Falkowbacteria bacterium]